MSESNPKRKAFLNFDSEANKPDLLKREDVDAAETDPESGSPIHTTRVSVPESFGRWETIGQRGPIDREGGSSQRG